jgi:hypothetical protein
MAQIGSFALLFALACSTYSVVAGVIAIVSKRAIAMPLGETARRFSWPGENSRGIIARAQGRRL